MHVLQAFFYTTWVRAVAYQNNFWAKINGMG